MPFSEPWNTTYERGDMIYGLKEERTNYMFTVNAFEHSIGDPTRFIDLFAGTTIEKEGVFKKKIWPVWCGDVNQEFLDFMQNHPKYHTALRPLTGRSSGEEEVEGKSDDVGRKVKGGIEWMVSRNDADRHHLHFILDGIDFDLVASKRQIIKPGMRHSEPSYTSVELRWLYRNRHEANVKLNVQFWINSVPCGPPWEDTFASAHPGGAEAQLAWQRYHPKSTPWEPHMDYECECFQKVHPQNGTFNARRTVYVCRTCGFGNRMPVFARMTAEHSERHLGDWCSKCNTQMWHRKHGTIMPGGSIYVCKCGNAESYWGGFNH
ncbi:Uncharacterised protein [BD1-7 clade bacterium]|uniref:Uncharacterized protein n=1 Tax=BD1-7 clade bacterium TaxID=2029982 RepID=A0A5S9PL20_9GAMM|nr:Uncharacterised protein [BD1-7 clade bacterium]CAA0104643.1 Uncharacterised protein [BD1-7 clade bacterium]